MRVIHLFLTVLLISILLTGCSTSIDQNATVEPLHDLFGKDSVIILVTDSGLGGLSVAANVAHRMDSLKIFRHVQVIFFNAQPSKEQGYNAMKTTEEKIAVFNNALMAMDAGFGPDIILVACNTLSVLYEYTEFSRSSNIPVIGVVEAGVELIQDASDDNEHSPVLLFATKTTVNQDTHRKMLVAKGEAPDDVVTQACPRLAGAIERGTTSAETDSLVGLYTKQAIRNLPEGQENVLISLNCTHYPYIKDLFREKVEEEGLTVTQVLDPNPYMADGLFPEQLHHRVGESEISVYVLSQPVLDDERLASIAPLIRKVSPETADALLDWDFDPQFFEWESFVKK